VLAVIREKKVLDDQIREDLTSATKEFNDQFLANRKAAVA
jgi:hypothetical protein